MRESSTNTVYTRPRGCARSGDPSGDTIIASQLIVLSMRAERPLHKFRDALAEVLVAQLGSWRPRPAVRKALAQAVSGLSVGAANPAPDSATGMSDSSAALSYHPRCGPPGFPEMASDASGSVRIGPRSLRLDRIRPPDPCVPLGKFVNLREMGRSSPPKRVQKQVISAIWQRGDPYPKPRNRPKSGYRAEIRLS